MIFLLSARRFPPGPGAKAAEDPTNLYFSNLPLDIDEEKLAAVLAPYGKVVSCRILRDYSTHASRGVGFARMQDRMTCEKIVTSLSGAILEGKTTTTSTHHQPPPSRASATTTFRACVRWHMTELHRGIPTG